MAAILKLRSLKCHPIKKAAQLNVNVNVSKISENIVRNNLRSQLGDNQILIEKPRIYINDAEGKATSKYATPDFAIVDGETGKIVKIVDAKNGNADLTTAQKELNKKGGTFKGSSRAPEANPNQIIPKNSIDVERTNVNNTGN